MQDEKVCASSVGVGELTSTLTSTKRLISLNKLSASDPQRIENKYAIVDVVVKVWHSECERLAILGCMRCLDILSIMGIKEVVAQIDAEIACLQQARALLASTGMPVRGKRGWSPINGSVPAKKKRNLTPEGRARIAEAVKRRWAKQKAIKSKAR